MKCPNCGNRLEGPVNYFKTNEKFYECWTCLIVFKYEGRKLIEHTVFKSSNLFVLNKKVF